MSFQCGWYCYLLFNQTDRKADKWEKRREGDTQTGSETVGRTGRPVVKLWRSKLQNTQTWVFIYLVLNEFPGRCRIAPMWRIPTEAQLDSYCESLSTAVPWLTVTLDRYVTISRPQSGLQGKSGKIKMELWLHLINVKDFSLIQSSLKQTLALDFFFVFCGFFPEYNFHHPSTLTVYFLLLHSFFSLFFYLHQLISNSFFRNQNDLFFAIFDLNPQDFM